MPQHLNLRQCAQPARGIVLVDGAEQPHAVLADLQHIRGQFLLHPGQPVIAGRTPVPLRPLGSDQGRQPLLIRYGKCLQRGLQRLGDQFHPVQLPHYGQHMSGIGPHAPTPLHQARRHQVVDHHSQQPVRPVALSHPVPELAEHRVVETGIVQLKTQTIFPVQPAADRLGGLPVTQVLRVLQHRHHRQPSRRQAPPPVGRIPVGEILVPEQLVQPVAHPHRRRAPRIARPRYPHRQRRNHPPGTWPHGPRGHPSDRSSHPALLSAARRPGQRKPPRPDSTRTNEDRQQHPECETGPLN